MPTDGCPCPICSEAGRRLEELSRMSAYIDYYRCSQCQHIWTVPKDECEPAHAITG